MRSRCGKMATMPPSSDFRLYHSNALDVLAGLLAAECARVPDDDDWLRPEVVLVPQYSMRRWLQQALAERLGICANLRFLTPGQFVEEVLDANLGAADVADRLAPDALRWHLLRALRARPPAALADFLRDGADDPRRAWSLAGALADTFEKYQAWRRDWLLRWERGADADDWQAALWRQVARGRAHRARRIDAYLRRFGAGGDAPAGMPKRLFVFACQNVSPDVLQVIASQARAGTQHFYLHTPARAYWGDLARWSDTYAPAEDDAFLGGERPNPLLAAWGQAGRDFVAALGSGEAVRADFEAAPFVEPPRDTLLGRLQADVLDNRAPLDGNALDRSSDAAWPRAQVDREDASLQFHACHTRLREVQVLHDQLRALLDAPGTPGRPQLQPRDIAVLAPDIDAYAPHIEAVFGGALGTPRELPYTLADTSPLASSPLADAFLRLLELPLRALTLADLIDLLAVPALGARFGIDDAARGALADWLQAAGARWGLDAADRARHGGAAEPSYTFDFAIERLLLGHASGSDDDIAGVAPWPELEGRATEALDGLLRLLALLRDTAASLSVAQPPPTWQKHLEALLDNAFAPGHDSLDAAVFKRLRNAVAAFADSARLADFDAPVEHAVVLDHLRAELSDADARAPFLSGGICFGRMVPMRLIPFRVICLLGLDEAAFPTRDARDPLNRMARALDSRERRVGDPSRRDADRYLFLQLLASAGRVFYLSWCGMDPRDNARREPSALVSELLDAAVRYHVADTGAQADAVREALVVRHALQPFAPAAFGAPHEGEHLPDDATTEPRRFSYDARWRPAAAEGVGTAALPVFAPPTLRLSAREEDADIDLDRLRATLLRPHAVYLQEGLGLRLPEEEPPLPEHEPLGAPDALDAWKLRQEAFDAWLREGAPPSPKALHARWLARALIAPGADGLAAVTTVLEEVAPFAELARAHGFTVAEERVPIAVGAGDRTIRGTLERVQGAHALRVVLNAGGVQGHHAVRHHLDALAAALVGRTLHVLAAPDKGAPPELTPLRMPDPDTAARMLASLDALRAQALRTPLVFLPKSAFAYVRRAADSGADAGLKDARDTWMGSEYQPDRAEATPATRIALRGRDPFFDHDADARERFQRLADAVFATLRGERPFDAELIA